MSERLKLMRAATRNRLELIRAGLSRRDLLRLGLLTSAGYLISKGGLSAGASGGQLTSPGTTPFVDPLPIPAVKAPVSVLTPGPTEAPNTAAGEARTRAHQRWSEFLPQKLYETREREAPHVWHRDLPLGTIWGYDGTFPGPTYHARVGESVLVRMFNDLPTAARAFGRPETTTHLHNGHTPSESDGNPLDYFEPGRFYDQLYPNCLAGYDAFEEGDPNEMMNTLWYHDHRLDFTSQNTYRGLEGFYLLFGLRDSGDEEDTNPAAFRLPSGPFDVPLLFADKVFDPDSGQLYFDLFALDGILGDKFTVNGRIQPHFKVHPRKYRFRCLDGGPARFYEFFLLDPKSPRTGIPLQQISSDGNLLPAPITSTSFRISPAERVDVVIDFSRFAGKTLFLENRLEMKDGRGPSGKTFGPGQGDRVLRFDVELPAVPDPSRVPEVLAEMPPIEANTSSLTRRTWRFDRTNGQWAINGKFFDPQRIDARPRRGTTEIWEFRNNSGGWSHPVHAHFEEVRVLTRNGRPAGPFEAGRKDVIVLGPNEVVEVQMRFRDFLGTYPLHCHNSIHEDHAMMTQWEIVE
jgi:FtsP/CotA-like multicopper oxidase with cupredoxin domain